MANNVNVKDFSGSSQTVKTTDTAGVHTPHHNVDALPTAVTTDIAAIKTATQLLDNAISGNEMQVDVVAALPAGTNNIGDVDILSIAAGENHIGEVSGNSVVIDVALSLDTAAYAVGDVLADTQAISSAMRVNAGTGVLHSLTLIDQDDQKAGMDIFFLDANQSLGTENIAPSITDANALAIQGVVNIYASDYIDLGGVSVVNKSGLGIVLKGGTGATTIWIAAITRGAPTHTASGVTVRLGILRD